MFEYISCPRRYFCHGNVSRCVLWEEDLNRRVIWGWGDAKHSGVIVLIFYKKKQDNMLLLSCQGGKSTGHVFKAVGWTPPAANIQTIVVLVSLWYHAAVFLLDYRIPCLHWCYHERWWTEIKEQVQRETKRLWVPTIPPLNTKLSYVCQKPNRMVTLSYLSVFFFLFVFGWGSLGSTVGSLSELTLCNFVFCSVTHLALQNNVDIYFPLHAGICQWSCSPLPFSAPLAEFLG